MKIRFFILTLILISISTYSFSKPMCQTLYDRIYNEADYKDITFPTNENVKTIGIRLLKEWNEDRKVIGYNGKSYTRPGWELSKTKDGYYKVGKITSTSMARSFPEKVEVGDIILSINDKDLRKYTDNKNLSLIQKNVSDLFEENEPIKFKILKKVKGKSKIVIIERSKTATGPKIRNEIESFDSPSIDLLLKSINVNEKDGTFSASIEKNFTERTDERHSITNIVWEELIKDKEFEGQNLVQLRWYQCPYSEEAWNDLDTIDLTYGYKFDNLIREDQNLQKSYYNISPFYDFDWKLMEEKNEKLLDKIYYKNGGTNIKYNSTGLYVFQNNFNLKTFPFDKQKLKIFLYNNLFDVNERRSSISSLTSKEANQFTGLNTISGWDIDSINLEYQFKEKVSSRKLYDGIAYEINISRKSGYYVFKIIFPILLILMICWSAVWINPKEIESRLTITIVCLLSLIAYNFVIDSDLPKLEYLTIMDYIILISYVYAAIPNFLSIYSFQLLKKNKALVEKYEFYEKRYGLPSYVLIIFLIIVINATNAPEHTNSMFTWAAMR